MTKGLRGMRVRGPQNWSWRALLVLALLAAGLVGVIWSSASRRTVRLGMHTLHPDDTVLQLAHAAGATYIVQVFSWSEIEPAPGQFYWEYYDWLVRATEYYGLEVVARLDKPPRWATGMRTTYSAPPRNPDTYAEFAGGVAARYRGRISAYIVWNEPNLAREWGNRPPDPAAYTDLLRRASAAIRQSDPAAKVLAAGLASTNQDDEQAMDDRRFLRGMYAAGARGAFDLLAAHPFGFGRSPAEPRAARAGLNLARLEDLREIMTENGDAATRIWITEFGYTTEAAPEEKEQEVNESTQGEYLAQAYARLSQQYPFVERMTVWNLARRDEFAASDEKAGYSLVRGDGSLKPAYEAVKQMTADAPRQILQRIGESLGLGSRPTAMAGGDRRARQVLAPDVLVHLGDSEYGPPWVPLYQGRNPATEWVGRFYLQPDDLARDWRLAMELMQVNDLGNRVLVNDRAVEPPVLPPEDFSGIWVTAQMEIPHATLRAGLNTVRLQAGKLVPPLQQYGFTWDDFQVRNVRLLPAAGR